MSDEHPEYNRDTNPYPSFGKKYNGEKAIISLTSWKKRINTVSKTLFSLIKQCPGFHIVLVLSEEEFPKMMNELPEELMLFVNNELVEILWVYKNYKTIKKIIFTVDKYCDFQIPIISADDDCFYKCNYAEELYQKWMQNKNSAIRYCVKEESVYSTQGPCTLYGPEIYKLFNINSFLIDKRVSADDAILTEILKNNKIRIIPIYESFNYPFIFHDELEPVSRGVYRKMDKYKNCYL